MMKIHRIAVLLMFVTSLVSSLATCAQDLDLPGEDLTDDKTSGLGLEDDDEMKEALKGGVLFKLVKFDKPDEGIADSLFWRTLPGQVAASTFPVKFSIGGKEVIKPEMLVNENDVGTTYRYEPEGRGDIRGEAVLQPCSLQVGRGSRHPAIHREGTELRILCAPVRFEAITTDGKPVARPVKVLFDDETLLREDANFCPLIMWLPIGVKYNSNWATFTVT
ncbi:MAG TPA: hypothetical protein VM186_09430, partial [Planctomycetota bacterium]|nr:hypothetical protein [Planctomycetota bacterium]